MFLLIDLTVVSGLWKLNFIPVALKEKNQKRRFSLLSLTQRCLCSRYVPQKRQWPLWLHFSVGKQIICWEGKLVFKNSSETKKEEKTVELTSISLNKETGGF